MAGGCSRVWLFLVVLCVFRAEPVNITVSNSTANRQGKNLLEWLGLDIEQDSDPYVSKANKACLGGDLYECFKHRVLTTLDDFFLQESYILSDQVRLLRMPSNHIREISKEPYEFSNEPRTDEPEWDQFVKFISRKVERFVKSTAFEIEIPEDITGQGRYSPRFIDEIYSEIDTLEDKNDSPFSRTKLKKLFVPMLIILKLFKLKLLLFLPLILGLASFKKVLGFLALVIPGLIAFFKLCKPDLHQNYNYGHSDYYHSPPHKYDLSGYALPDRRVQQTTLHTIEGQQNSHISFKYENDPHNLAYESYYQKRLNNR